MPKLLVEFTSIAYKNFTSLKADALHEFRE